MIPAKVLLFGEYTVLIGSKALSTPYGKMYGKWSFGPIESKAAELSHKVLKDYLKHDSHEFVDHERLASDIQRGLWFDSNIPHGFGLGSSGAVSAAIYKDYGFPQSSMVEDRKALAKIEDFFHGSSSGLDALVSLLQRPLLMHNVQNIEALESELDLSGFFLLSTGQARHTERLVNLYKEKLKDPVFNSGCKDVLSLEVDLAIASLLNREKKGLYEHFRNISNFQWHHFREMIPNELHAIWQNGLDEDEFSLKLCGAGGGGFILGYSKDFSSIEDKFKSFECKIL